MNTLSRSSTIKLASRLASAYPGHGVREEHIAMWANELGQLSPKIAVRAVALLIRRCARPPTVAQLHEAAHEAARETPSPALTDGTEVGREESERLGRETLSAYFGAHPERRRTAAGVGGGQQNGAGSGTAGPEPEGTGTPPAASSTGGAR